VTDAPEKPIDESVSLYISEAELHRRVAAKLGRDRFRAAVKLYEAEGFPRIHEVWGGRNWPECLAWLTNQNKAVKDGVPQAAEAEDGQEDFNAAPGKKARSQNRAPQAPVLVREAGVPRSHGVSRHLHTVATGRER
jgi:hypothetical protein